MGPLKDIKVIEMAGIGPAPFCGMILADMGAEVISVERINAVGRGSNSDIASRGKKSMTVDIRKTEGQEIIKKRFIQKQSYKNNFDISNKGLII